jgi:hypothetical protein
MTTTAQMPSPLTSADHIRLAPPAFTAVVDNAPDAELVHWLCLARLNVAASTHPDRRRVAIAHDLVPLNGPGGRDRRMSDAAVAAAHADQDVAQAMLWRIVDAKPRYAHSHTPAATRSTLIDLEAASHLRWRDTPSGRRPFADYLQLDISADRHPTVRWVDDRAGAAVTDWLLERDSDVRRAFAVELFREQPLDRQRATDPWHACRAMRRIVGPQP